MQPVADCLLLCSLSYKDSQLQPWLVRFVSSDFHGRGHQSRQCGALDIFIRKLLSFVPLAESLPRGVAYATKESAGSILQLASEARRFLQSSLVCFIRFASFLR
jgi:hypothetical protein